MTTPMLAEEEFLLRQYLETRMNLEDYDFKPLFKAFDDAFWSGNARPSLRCGNIVAEFNAAYKAHNDPRYKIDAISFYRTDGKRRYLGQIWCDGVSAWNDFAREAENLDPLRRIALNPQAEATRHGKETGTCSICGRPLSDPKSLRAGIGPICAGNFGFETEADEENEDG